MTIEVKQLIIRSAVTKDGPRMVDKDHRTPRDDKKLRAAILAECRELIAQHLRDAKER